MDGKTFLAAFLIVLGLALIYIVVKGRTGSVVSAIESTGTSTAKAA